MHLGGAEQDIPQPRCIEGVGPSEQRGILVLNDAGCGGLAAADVAQAGQARVGLDAHHGGDHAAKPGGALLPVGSIPGERRCDHGLG